MEGFTWLFSYHPIFQPMEDTQQKEASTMKYWSRGWNPIFGCKKISEGCEHCFAEELAYRRHLTKDFLNVGINYKQIKKRLDNEPELIGVCSQSDLFQESVEDRTVNGILRKCAECKAKTFLICTKRAERMQKYMSDDRMFERMRGYNLKFDIDNLVFGVSVESNRYMHRIDLLRDCKHVQKRFVAFEPLLEDINVEGRLDNIDWVVVGAESGASARPCKHGWVTRIVDECDRVGIPVFVNWVDESDLQGVSDDDLDKVSRSDCPFYSDLPNYWDRVADTGIYSEE